MSIELWLWLNMRLCYDWTSARNGFVYFAIFERYYCLWNSILNHYSEPLFVFLKIVCFPSSICFTVTKMWQKIGHIARRIPRNLTKYIKLLSIVQHLVKLRRLRRAMCPIFCHILVTVKHIELGKQTIFKKTNKGSELWFKIEFRKQ